MADHPAASQHILDIGSGGRESIRSRYYQCITESDVHQMTLMVREWLQKQQQQHQFPQNQTDSLLERFLLRNKFQVERTKQKLVGYYVLRSHMQYFYRAYDSHLRPEQQALYVVPMPKLIESSKCRPIVMRFQMDEVDRFNATDNMVYIWLMFELLLRYDYNNGDIFIFDCSAIQMGHLRKMLCHGHPTQLYRLYQDGYSGRLNALYFLNPPSFMGAILGLFKTILPGKLHSKMHIARDVTVLQQAIGVDYLPKDYGGKLPSLQVLQEEWSKFFCDHRDLFDENFQHVISCKLDDISLGGSFRQLEVD